MAEKALETSSQPLKYQTWVLKVPIHCEGCKKKVKKVLHHIDGVYRTTIDSQSQKVIVTGNVETETLLKKLKKSGKHAEIWPESSEISGKSKNRGKQKNEESVENCVNVDENLQIGQDGSAQNGVNFSTTKSKNGGKLPESSTASEESAEVKENGDGHSGKKKKKKGQNGNNVNGGSGSVEGSEPAASLAVEVEELGTGPVNVPYPNIHIPHITPIYGYNAVYPNNNHGPYYYYHAPSPYTYANQGRSTAYNSFEVLGDQNASWCSIM